MKWLIDRLTDSDATQAIRESREGTNVEKYESSNWRQKVSNDDDQMTASDRPSHTWAAVASNARLPTLSATVKTQLNLTDLSPTTVSPVLAPQCHSTTLASFSGVPEPLPLSMPAVPNCCHLKGSAPYWSNPPFLIFDIRALWRSVLSARVPECQKLKMVG